MKVLLILSPPDNDIGNHLTTICNQYGVEAFITDGTESINEAPDLAIIFDSVAGEPGMLMKMLASSNVPVYFLTSQSGLTIFNAVKQAGGKGIIPTQTAVEDFTTILNNLSGVNSFKQSQNIGRRQFVRSSPGNVLPHGKSVNVQPVRVNQPQIATNQTAAALLANERPAAPTVNPMTSYGINKQIIVSYAFKGGVGKSTLASNLAVLLASIPQPKLSVCLVDFDINAAGRMADILNVAPTTTVLDWVATKYKEDISHYLVDGPCGIKFLPSPRRAHDERAVTKEVAENVLQTLTRRFDIVIVDTPYVLRDSTIVAFDMATKIFLLGILDRPTLRGVYDISQTLDALRIDPAKIQFILNMVPKRSSLRIEDFHEAIKYPLLASIPHDPSVQTAVNRCDIPVLDPKTKLFTTGLNKVVASIVPSYQYSSESKDSGFTKLFSFLKRR